MNWNRIRPALAPLTPLYAAAAALRNLSLERGWEPVQRLRFPVISIGNLTTGGSGKTPLTIALAGALAERGIGVDVLSRGYGRSISVAARVQTDGSAERFGDEPLLIARQTGVPVYVARRRYEAGLLAEAEAAEQYAAHQGRRAQAHILDDGFQHRQLHRDVDIVLLDSADWRDRLLPAGNLREPLKALHRASVIAVPADQPNLESDLRAWGWRGPLWRLHRTMDVPAVNGPVAAFCGIARPEQFFTGLEAAGVQIAARRAFPDHHRYTLADLGRLTAIAWAAGATALVTTEKDLARLGTTSAVLTESMPLETARLRVEIENANEAFQYIEEQLIELF